MVSGFLSLEMLDRRAKQKIHSKLWRVAGPAQEVFSPT
jgi:hypothetical protein